MKDHQSQTSLHRTTKDHRIVVVDPSDELVRILREEFQDQDIGIDHFVDDQGLASFVISRAPDLILLEVDFPGKDGFSICRELKEHPVCESVPVVFVSRKTGSDNKVKGLELGADDYICKPCNRDELLARVHVALRHKSHQDLLMGRGQIDHETGLWNRHYFDYRLKEEYSAFRRYKRGFTIMLAQIDHYEDEKNPELMDKTVTAISRMLWSYCRTSDVPCHLYDGRFAVILSETTHHQSMVLAERLRKDARSLQPENSQSPITISISLGIASTDNMPSTDILMTQVIATAEYVLKKSIDSGGNRTTMAHQEDFLNAEYALEDEQPQNAKEERKRQEEYEYLAAIHQTTLALVNHRNILDVVKTILHRALEIVDADDGFIFLLRPTSTQQELKCIIATGTFSKFENQTRAIDTSLIGETVTSGETQIRNQNLALSEDFPSLDEGNIQSAICMPLESDEQVVGVIGIAYSDDRIFDHHRSKLLDGYIELASISLDNIRLYELSQKELHERRRIEKELERARRNAESTSLAKSTFVANISHELRTPLNAIMGYSEFILEDMKNTSDSKYMDDMNNIVAASEHLLTLINGILDFSKIESGRSNVYLETFSLQETLNAVISTIKPSIEKNNNKFTCSFNGQPEVIRSDQTKLRQVLLNILNNAAKFTKDGQIHLEAINRKVDADDYVIFKISDTGIGMTPEQVESIFQPFVQGDISTTRRYGGTGLGLAITKSFCELLGGRITVESEIDKGSTFTVSIPVNGYFPQVDLLPSNYQQPDKEPKLLMFTPDDQIEQSLNMKDLVIYQEETLKHGFEKAFRLRPDVILIDTSTTGDLNDLLTKLKGDMAIGYNPIVILTGQENILEHLQGFSRSSIDFISQPVTTLELQARIRNALNSKQYLDTLEQQTQLDALTGLWNHAHFLLRLSQETEMVRRYHRPISVVKLDLDHFTNLNDIHGYLFGNQLLINIAETITHTCRTCDIPCRTGPDEFTLILPDTDNEQATVFIQRLSHALNQEIDSTARDHKLKHLPVSASIGLTSSSLFENAEGVSGDEILKLVDASLESAREYAGNSAFCKGPRGIPHMLSL